ncbi:MAG TPA: glycosyltransferase family 39 protein [Bacteroidales bacterium]|nr:glycosyltransferase family 39 protein [Bacteroidales bacterium]
MKILLVAVAGILARLLLGHYVFGFNSTHYDSGDYLLAADMLRTGTLHSSRLLTYPVLLLCCGWFAPLAPLESALLWVQSGFGLGSAVLIFLILKRLLRDESWALVAALLFAIDPYLISWEHCMMTESLALLVALAMLYLFLRVMEGGRPPWAAGLIVLTLLGIFLKLYFFWLALGMAVLFLSQLKQISRGTIRTLLAGAFIVFIAVTGFSMLNNRQHGIPGLSETTRVLQLQKVYDYALFQAMPEQEISREMAMARQQGRDFWQAFNALLTHHSRKELYAFNTALRRHDPWAYLSGFLQGTLRNTIHALLHPAATFYAFTRMNIAGLEPFRLPVLLFLFPAFSVPWLRFRSQNSKLVRRALLFAAGGTVLAFVLMAAGSSVEFSRFFYPVLGYSWILWTLFLHNLIKARPIPA